MGHKSSRKASDNESSRDSRLKLILLFVALVLVAGYAAWMTDAISSISRGLAMFGAGIPVLPAAGAIVAVAVIVLAIFAIRRRRPAKANSTPMEGADAGVALMGSRDFLKALSGQFDAHTKSGRQLAIHLVDIDRFHLSTRCSARPRATRFCGSCRSGFSSWSIIRSGWRASATTSLP